MLTHDQIELKVAEHVSLIAITADGLAEGRERCAKFLVMIAILTDYLKQVDTDIAGVVTLKDAMYSQAIKGVSGKNVTEKKINVAENTDYTQIRQQYEEMQALHEWVKGHIKIFDHAHLMYRQAAAKE